MPRRPRLRMSGVPMHVVQRSVDRRACFLEDGDRHAYLAFLGRASVEHPCRIHAYVLMTNHVHLLLTEDVIGAASRMMQAVGRRYVPFFNERRQRSGTLWESRFHASLVESEAYLLECQRYIELNPVRAGIVDHPGDYAWSSFRRHAFGAADPVVTPHEIDLRFGSEEERARAYAGFVGTPVSESTVQRIREAVNRGRVLGTDTFVEAIERQLGSTLRPRRPGRPRKSGSDPDFPL